MATNYGTVKVKETRICEHCGALIEKGSECFTVSSFGRGRQWYCDKECFIESKHGEIEILEQTEEF